jgi:uncharacterized NAD(P)/FAD-binding protein YdhS
MTGPQKQMPIRIAIVGGGATGALAAVHLARRFDALQAVVVLIEPSAAIGRGLAYSTRDPGHLLNVRVANMSAFADEPDHLFDWLDERGTASGVECPTQFCFIPRSTYGDYISDLVGRSLASGAVHAARDACVDIEEGADEVTLHLASGRAIVADRVVLATGHDAKLALDGVPAAQAWAEDALDDLPRNAPLLILGSGLTMVDMAVSLDRRGHRGPITVVSRRGLAPSAHRPVAPREAPAETVPFGTELSGLLRWLRGLAAKMSAEGADWRSAVDALRPYTQRLWRSMSDEQKRRFLRHARVYWDIHRHRMAPEIERRILSLRSSGRLTIIAGRALAAVQRPDGVHVRIARRGTNATEDHRFTRIIDCTGLPDDPNRSENPLIRALLARGAARADPLGVGLDVAEDYALIDAGGRRSPRIQVIGPLARAAFWECIAIPDIRLQCLDIADGLAAAAAATA